MNASDYVLKRLAEAGVAHAFLVYGGAISELVDAFARQDSIAYVVTQHEQAAGFAAEGYAKACDNLVPGVAIATSGPGGGNLVTAIQNCYYDSTPVVFITGQVSTGLLNNHVLYRQRGFQETPIVDIVQSITKRAVQVRDMLTLEIELERCLNECLSGRPGPVLLDICLDVQRKEITPRVERVKHTPFYPHSPAFTESFLNALKASNRPAVLVGGGCRSSRNLLWDALAELRIPAFTTWNAIDLVPSAHPCYAGRVGTYGGEGRNLGIQNCDLLLSLGCRFSGRITGGVPSSFARGAKIYAVDISPRVIGLAQREGVLIAQSLESSVGAFLQGLRGNVFPVPSWVSWTEQCREWRLEYDPVRLVGPQEGNVHHYAALRRISVDMPSNAIIVADTGGSVVMTAHAFDTKTGQTFFSSNGNSPMGFALCGAIGAAFAHPDRPVYCIIGDGGMQLNIQELQTIRHYNLPIKIIVLNNGILGNTKAYQIQNDRARLACGPDGYSAPNFTAIAQVYGLRADQCYVMDELEDLISEMKQNGPYLLELHHPDFCDYRPRMTLWGAGVEEMYPPINLGEEMMVPPLVGWEERAKTYKEMK